MICARSLHACARSCEATPAADPFRRCRRRVDTRRRRCAEDCLVGPHEGDPGKSKIQHGRNALDALDHAGGNCGEQHFGWVEGIGRARKPGIQSDLRHFGMSNTFVQIDPAGRNSVLQHPNHSHPKSTRRTTIRFTLSCDPRWQSTRIFSQLAAGLIQPMPPRCRAGCATGTTPWRDSDQWIISTGMLGASRVAFVTPPKMRSLRRE